MKAIVVRGAGRGVDAWELAERAAPRPGAGEVLVRVRAVSLNYRDLMIVRGVYPGQKKDDLIPASDGAGEVIAVGAGVTAFGVGDRVAGAFHPRWAAGPIDVRWLGQVGAVTDGWLAEEVVFPAEGLVRLPDHLSYEEAATLPCAAVTAWTVMFAGVKPLQPGQTLLVQGTGGVSIFAAQLALASGVRVIATTSSAAKAARLRDLGVHDIVDYKKTPAWSEEVLRLSPGGVDKILEVGGADSFAQSLAAARLGGSIHLVGFVTGSDFDVNPKPILFKSLSVEGVLVGPRQSFEDMNRLLAGANLHPILDEVFPFARAKEALAKLESGTHFGKIVVSLPQS